ncbi:hypothetical protein [Actinocatenispora sera]|uniref:Repetin n=1 Tax=Actinocatenispora sera TaxID=390989 RepID=A0A810KXA0_9ACTN|nr:hypothetical protein [Actinocatenispora sera]BCJ27860.1 hypothetical protein Asera_19680 [Actinocatenispora sera]
MHRNGTRPRTAIGVTIAAVLAAGLVSAGAAAAPAHPDRHHASPGDLRPASVAGAAGVFYAYSPDDTIRFRFDATAKPFSRPLPGLPSGLPTDATGTVRISHHVAAQNVTVTAEGRVDCLVTGGRTATLTAVITRADPQVADWVGTRRGFSVTDGRGPAPDRMGFSWDIVNFDTDGAGNPTQPSAGTCLAPAPFAPVLDGGFRVHATPLPPKPTS